MQEKYRDRKKKLYMCFVDIEKAFDRVPSRDAEAEAVEAVLFSVEAEEQKIYRFRFHIVCLT